MNLIHDRVIGAGSSWEKNQSCVTAHRLSVQKLVKQWQWCKFRKKPSPRKNTNTFSFLFLRCDTCLHTYSTLPSTTTGPSRPFTFHNTSRVNIEDRCATIRTPSSHQGDGIRAHQAIQRDNFAGQSPHP